MWWRLGLNVAGPLLVVDATLYACQATTSTAAAANGSLSSSSYYYYDYDYDSNGGGGLPLLSIRWLIDFLLETENGHERFWGLLYWAAMLAVASVPTGALLSLAAATTTTTAPSKQQQQHKQPRPSVAVTRKWFHLVAVVLFGPITVKFPELMALSYAVAASVLVVAEAVRSDVPSLQAFYGAFLDDRKDEGASGDKLVVSHLFLVVGCALPLWIGRVIASASNNANANNLLLPPTSLVLLLGEFGVLCIGIGDAMGAVVGKSLGTHGWGRNKRTLEGSLAMWLSMVVVGCGACCTSLRECGVLLVAATGTTILEAFTVQLDNLVLPIFGSCVVLLLLAVP